MTKKILVVDDARPILMLFEQICRRGGADVVKTAESAEEALQILEEERFGAMFFDLQLPGMSGVNLCKKIRKRFPEALIVAVTGHPKVFELAACREAGFDHYLTKPIDRKKVWELIRGAGL